MNELTNTELDKIIACLEELAAYRATGYTPEQVQELHDKHWDEFRQIAHYDNEQKQSRWIPCSERMPESGLEVHVYAKTLKGLGYCFDAYYAASAGKWHTYTSWAKEEIVGYRSDVSHDFIITHWMPLPEPPEEREEYEENE